MIFVPGTNVKAQLSDLSLDYVTIPCQLSSAVRWEGGDIFESRKLGDLFFSITRGKT